MPTSAGILKSVQTVIYQRKPGRCVFPHRHLDTFITAAMIQLRRNLLISSILLSGVLKVFHYHLDKYFSHDTVFLTTLHVRPVKTKIIRSSVIRIFAEHFLGSKGSIASSIVHTDWSESSGCEMKSRRKSCARLISDNPVKYSAIVCIDWSDCAELGFCCPLMPEKTFCMARPILFFTFSYVLVVIDSLL